MRGTSKRTWVYTALLALAAFSLSACGGGGGSGGRRTNAPPVFGALAFSTKQNTDMQGQVPATDAGGETLTFTVTTNPASGTLVSFSPAGAFVYRPAPGFLGDDTFRVQVTDSGGNTVTGTVNINVHPNRAPVATGDALRADGAALTNITVLANDTDADSDPLTVAIEEAPLAGIATVNTDSSIGISSLPGGFKGVTRFKYRVTDSSSASAIGTAAVFVGVEPFRVIFAGDQAANGSSEVFITDLAASPVALTTATEGNMRLRGFVASRNGATVVYRREDQSNAAQFDLKFVRTATTPIQTGTVPLPSGATLPLGSDSADQFIVSPDGQWVALVARVGSVDGVYVLNVTAPTVLNKVSPANTVFASKLRFSSDSRLFFLASPVAGGGSKSLYTMSPAAPSAAVAVSAISDPATTDDVFHYAISPNQTSIVVHANRGGRHALLFIDARQLQTEVQLSHPLAGGESISDSTLSLTSGTIGGGVGQRIGYTVSAGSLLRAYVAEVSAIPNPREVATGAYVVGLRPDDGALLYFKGGQIYEHDLVTVGTDTIVAAGGTAWYDSTGNIVLVQQAQFSGPTLYPVLAATTRGAFGSAQPLGTPAQAARFSELSGFDRGVAVLAEGAPAGATPTRARIALVNALAPDKLLYLSDFESPLQLTSSPAVVVSR